MFATVLTPRLTRLAILAVTGAIALFVAACGTSNNQNARKPTTSASPTRPAPTSPPSASAPAEGKDHVEGMISSVSGNVIRLTQRDRTPATVDFTPSTKVIAVTPGQLTDVAAGSCVDVSPAPEGTPAGGAITAQSVEISPAVDGKCPPQPAASAPPENRGVSGTVASVSGNTITVTSTDAGDKTTQTNVTVTDATSYSKQAAATTQDIQQGKCMATQGTKDSSGVLQATTISLEPCPPLGGHHHHFPHLPHRHHHHGA
jgi:hypothetical protein